MTDLPRHTSRLQFTLDHLFDALEESRETRADVRVVSITVEDMVRLRGGANYSLTVETECELFDYKEWYTLLQHYYPMGTVKTRDTSMTELRQFFDDDMLEFFEEYRPVLRYNDETLDIDTFLTSDEILYFGHNTDT